MMTHKKMWIYSLVTVGIVFLLILMMSGCGPPVAGSGAQWTDWMTNDINYNVNIFINVNSEPRGAKVYANDTFRGHTPIRLEFNTEVGYHYTYRLLFASGSGGNILQEEKGKDQFIFYPQNQFKVTVYQDGYIPKTNVFRPDENLVRQHREPKHTFSNYVLNWTAFLQRDEKQPSVQQQQQQQQQIIIEKPKAVSYLSVSSDPSDAEVYLDGNLIGTTPINNMKLNPGNYRLKVMKGSKTWERNIMMPEEGSLQIKAKPE